MIDLGQVDVVHPQASQTAIDPIIKNIWGLLRYSYRSYRQRLTRSSARQREDMTGYEKFSVKTGCIGKFHNEDMLRHLLRVTLLLITFK
jgi:hypothetical protein